MKLDIEYHGLGITLRNQDGVKVLFNEFDRTSVFDYHDIVAKPFIS
jgi:hypothetical protein